MLELTDLGIKGWASIPPLAITYTNAKAEPKKQTKPKIAKEKDPGLILRDLLAEYRDKELDFKRTQKKANDNPDAWDNVKSFIAHATAVISKTDDLLEGLPAAPKENGPHLNADVP
jgi:hypothetical protein